jgi:hypothetical protein
MRRLHGAGWPLHDSRKAAGESGFSGLAWCRAVPASAGLGSAARPGSQKRRPARVYRFLRILAYLNPMVESRRASRLHVSKAGTIKFVGGGAINCLVRNLSSTGAALEVSNQARIPERFVLVMPGDGLHRPCLTVWRKEHRIGITFD